MESYANYSKKEIKSFNDLFPFPLIFMHCSFGKLSYLHSARVANTVWPCRSSNLREPNYHERPASLGAEVGIVNTTGDVLATG